MDETADNTVLNALSPTEARSIEDICRETQLDAEEATEAIARLQAAGKAISETDNEWMRLG